MGTPVALLLVLASDPLVVSAWARSEIWGFGF